MKPQQPQNKTQIFSELGPYLGLGVQLAATIIIMVYIGDWLDTKYNTSPRYTLICAIFGIFAGMYNLIKIVLGLEKRNKAKKDETQN
ncbi:MAG: AtpZ/AtpI family protein [Ignavibacteriaceae bacterium]|nr:AtpZ/AtpI family protein [Ignavibacteriaceae bacterium]